MLDGAFVALLLAALIGLAAAGALTAATAHAAIGLTCLVTAGGWLWLKRHDFRLRREMIVTQFRKNWSLGRWGCASQIVAQINSQTFILWLLAFVSGKTSVGTFSACMSVVLLSNLFVLGMGSVLTARIARGYAEGGRSEMKRVVWKTTILMGLVMLGFCGVLAGFGDQLVTFLYGARYAGHGHMISVLAFAVLAATIAMSASSGLWTMERPDLSFMAGVIGMVVTVGCCVGLVVPFGFLGVAYGWLAGRIASAMTRWVLFLRLANERS